MSGEDEPEKLPLDRLPIDWVEPRVCEETFENRRLLRENGHRWRPLPPDPDTGMPSGLIEVPDPGADNLLAAQRHADVLSDPRDPWSDYVDVREIPMDAVGVPYWIHRRAEKWREWEASEGKESTYFDGTPAKKAHRGREPYLPVRCGALKRDGTRCWGWSAEAATEGRCRRHAPGAALAANMGHQIMLAKVKVVQAMPAMVDELEGLALGAASEQVRLKAITEMMDRGGVNAQTDVNVTGRVEVQDPAATVRERLAELGERLRSIEPPAAGDDGVVDAEVVEDGGPAGETA